MTKENLKQRLEQLAPGTRVELTDLTGTQDHWQALIVSSVFTGKSLIDRHKLVMSLVSSEIDSNEVHALTLKTYTPEQFKTLQTERTPQ